jgi:hypothetical protein
VAAIEGARPRIEQRTDFWHGDAALPLPVETHAPDLPPAAIPANGETTRRVRELFRFQRNDDPLPRPMAPAPAFAPGPRPVAPAAHR